MGDCRICTPGPLQLLGSEHTTVWAPVPSTHTIVACVAGVVVPGSTPSAANVAPMFDNGVFPNGVTFTGAGVEGTTTVGSAATQLRPTGPVHGTVCFQPVTGTSWTVYVPTATWVNV